MTESFESFNRPEQPAQNETKQERMEKFIEMLRELEKSPAVKTLRLLHLEAGANDSSLGAVSSEFIVDAITKHPDVQLYQAIEKILEISSDQK